MTTPRTQEVTRTCSRRRSGLPSRRWGVRSRHEKEAEGSKDRVWVVLAIPVIVCDSVREHWRHFIWCGESDLAGRVSSNFLNLVWAAVCVSSSLLFSQWRHWTVVTCSSSARLKGKGVVEWRPIHRAWPQFKRIKVFSPRSGSALFYRLWENNQCVFIHTLSPVIEHLWPNFPIWMLSWFGDRPTPLFLLLKLDSEGTAVRFSF